uniref:glutamyl-tRNA(Gln) amidotransferase subunit C, mitochondrial-like isoform X1 n=1 Tax=Myxine glutinosa TaxID=7769 RepID=UPI00358E8C55
MLMRNMHVILGRTLGRGLTLSTKVPQKPTWSMDSLSHTCEESSIEPAMVEHLERLSLVAFATAEGVERLKQAVKFAELLQSVDTTGVEPLESLFEEGFAPLRDDHVTQASTEKILANASKSKEEYFVAPPDMINKQGHWDATSLPVGPSKTRDSNKRPLVDFSPPAPLKFFGSSDHSFNLRKSQQGSFAPPPYRPNSQGEVTLWITVCPISLA